MSCLSDPEMNSSSWLRSFRPSISPPHQSRIARRGNQQAMTFSTTPVVCLTLAKWETVSGQFGGYLSAIGEVLLCGVSVVFNSLGDILGLVSCKRSSESGQVLVGFQSTEALGRFQHAGGRPAQRHRGIAPALHVATNATHCPHDVLDRVGAGERAPELYGQAEAVDGQHLVEFFEDAGGDRGCLLIKPAGEIAQQSLGLIGIVELPSLPEHPAYRRMQRLGQPLDHVAGFMKLAALDRW